MIWSFLPCSPGFVLRLPMVCICWECYQCPRQSQLEVFFLYFYRFGSIYGSNMSCRFFLNRLNFSLFNLWTVRGSFFSTLKTNEDRKRFFLGPNSRWTLTNSLTGYFTPPFLSSGVLSVSLLTWIEFCATGHFRFFRFVQPPRALSFPFIFHSF